MLSEQVIYYWNDELQYYYLAEKKNGSYKFVQPLKKLELDDISDPLEREQMKKIKIKKTHHPKQPTLQHTNLPINNTPNPTRLL